MASAGSRLSVDLPALPARAQHTTLDRPCGPRRRGQHRTRKSRRHPQRPGPPDKVAAADAALRSLSCQIFQLPDMPRLSRQRIGPDLPPFGHYFRGAQAVVQVLDLAAILLDHQRPCARQQIRFDPPG